MNEEVTVEIDINVGAGSSLNNLRLVQTLRKALEIEIAKFGYANISGHFAKTAKFKFIRTK